MHIIAPHVDATKMFPVASMTGVAYVTEPTKKLHAGALRSRAAALGDDEVRFRSKPFRGHEAVAAGATGAGRCLCAFASIKVSMGCSHDGFPPAAASAAIRPRNARVTRAQQLKVMRRHKERCGGGRGLGGASMRVVDRASNCGPKLLPPGLVFSGAAAGASMAR